MEHVSKIRIRVTSDSDDYELLSIKRAEGTKKHGKLELLGGHVEKDEQPLEALIRELQEEESSGFLARRAVLECSSPAQIDVAGAHHYVFGLTITSDEFSHLVAGKEESLGFQLISINELRSDDMQGRMTSRSGQLLKACVEGDVEQ